MASADNRLWAAVAAQTAGVLILFLVGIIFDIWNEPCFAEMEAGIHHIFVIAFMVFVGLLVGCVQVFVPTQKCELGDDHVDKVIKTFLVTDVPLLTLLVCLEGGLVSSVFAPLFFLIFVAYNAVEQPGRLRRKLLVLSLLGLGIVCCSVVSYLVGLGVLKNLFGLRSLSITLFSNLDTTRYNINFLLVTLLSLAAYIVQLNIIKVPRGKRHFQGDGAPDDFDHERKENTEPRVPTNSKLIYVLALIFASIFIASLTILLGGGGGVFRPTSESSVVTIIAVIASAIGTISTTILGWRKDRREAREMEIKLLQLKQELEAASETPASPVPQEKRE